MRRLEGWVAKEKRGRALMLSNLRWTYRYDTFLGPSGNGVGENSKTGRTNTYIRGWDGGGRSEGKKRLSLHHQQTHQGKLNGVYFDIDLHGLDDFQGQNTGTYKDVRNREGKKSRGSVIQMEKN